MSRTRGRGAFLAGALATAGVSALALFAGLGSASTQAGTPPSNASVPAISGSPYQGATLTASTGGWNGDTPISYAYQWQSCDTSGSSCASIAGATGQTHVVTAGEVGHTIRVFVTATNAAGTAGALSAPTATIATASAPASSAAPAIGGAAVAGQALTTTDGTWTGTPPPTFTYAWQQCNAGGGSCTTLTGASAQTFTPTASQVGSTIRSIVTARNAAGSASAQSGATAPVTAAGGPRPTAQPNVTGTLRVGQTLTAQTGTWSGSTPLAFTFAWQRCNAAGASCAPISGAVHQTYVVTAADAGARLRALVTAKNAQGTGTVLTNLTASPIGGATAKPAALTAPAIAGSAATGSKLTVTAGTWSGQAPISLAYAWQRCDAKGGACVAIAGATSTAYAVVSADTGHTLRAQVTASNAGGSTAAVSAQTAVVGAAVGGRIALPGGGHSVPAASVSPPQRLIVSTVRFAPARIAKRTPFEASFRVTDTNGDAVRGALVYAVALPYGLIAQAPETQTDASGFAVIRLLPTAKLPLRRGSVQFFVRARKAGDPLLAGVSTRRLVQVLVRP